MLWTWQQSMIRVKDPEKSLAFYQGILGMTLVDTFDFPQYEFKLFFLQSLPKGSYKLEPGSEEAHKYLWSTRGVTVELTYNYGTEKQDDFKYHPGNADKDGFGHLAVACEDVYASCDRLEKAGVQFRKKPDEGRMKGLAFVYDPDGYWIEVIKRTEPGDFGLEYILAQTMLRVKDPKKSIPFYQKLGMTLVREIHFSSFSLYFLATLPEDGELARSVPDPAGPDASAFVNGKLHPVGIPVLELTHNHGTEDDEKFVHYNGNTEPRKGFGHIGFLVDDVYAAYDELSKDGVEFAKTPDGGSMKGLAFAKDPDGYLVEIIKRASSD